MYKNCLLLVVASHGEKGGREKTASHSLLLFPSSPAPPLSMPAMKPVHRGKWPLFADGDFKDKCLHKAAHCTTPDPGGRGGGYPKKFYKGRLHPRSSTLLKCTPFIYL